MHLTSQMIVISLIFTTFDIKTIQLLNGLLLICIEICEYIVSSQVFFLCLYIHYWYSVVSESTRTLRFISLVHHFAATISTHFLLQHIL